MLAMELVKLLVNLNLKKKASSIDVDSHDLQICCPNGLELYVSVYDP